MITMITMIPLRYCRRETVTALHNTVHATLDWYYHPQLRDPLPPLARSGAELESGLQVEPFWSSLQMPRESDNPQERAATDRANVLIARQALDMLTPVQAADGRLWTWLAHTHCAEYVKRRWMHSRPDEEREAIRAVQNHFFVRGSRSLIRENGVSRLWWIGEIAHRVEPGGEEQFLEVMLSTQEIRQQVLERPGLTMNTHVLRALYRLMRRRWESDGPTAPLLEREAFRRWMRRLNGRGGVALLDAMNDDQLQALLEFEAERALSA